MGTVFRLLSAIAGVVSIGIAATHVALAPGKDGRPPTPEAILADVRRGYASWVEVGEDLMQIEIGDEVVVRRAPVVAGP